MKPKEIWMRRLVLLALLAFVSINAKWMVSVCFAVVLIHMEAMYFKANQIYKFVQELKDEMTKMQGHEE